MRDTDLSMFDTDDWRQVEIDLGIDGHVETRVIQTKKRRGVFICKNVVWKVNLLGEPPQLEDFQSLKMEAEVLRQLQHTGRVPNVVTFIEYKHMEALCLTRVEGHALDECEITLSNLIYIQWDALKAIHVFAKLGFVHGDLAPYNIFLNRDSRLCFIDFGHCYKSSYISAMLRSLFFMRIAHPKFNRPYLVTLIRLIEFSLPDSAQKIYRKFLRINRYQTSTHKHQSKYL